jgi:hypothetical protein
MYVMVYAANILNTEKETRIDVETFTPARSAKAKLLLRMMFYSCKTRA